MVGVCVHRMEKCVCVCVCVCLFVCVLTFIIVLVSLFVLIDVSVLCFIASIRGDQERGVCIHQEDRL